MAKVHGPRIKAARGFAGGISTAELGKRVGVSESTVKRWEAGDPSLTVGYRLAIATVCGVPVEFMEHGWGAPKADEVRELLTTQNEVLDGLKAAVESLNEAIKREEEAATRGARLLDAAADHIGKVLPPVPQDPEPGLKEPATSDSPQG